MKTQLYSKNDNEQLTELLELMNQRNNEARLNTQRSIDKPEDVISNSFTKPFDCTPFVVKNNKHDRWNVDQSFLAPSIKATMSGKKFQDVYLSELEGMLYHTQETPQMNSIVEIMHLYERVRSQGSIAVVYATGVRRLPQVVFVLNKFFRNNLHVIDAISTMVGNRLTPSFQSVE